MLAAGLAALAAGAAAAPPARAPTISASIVAAGLQAPDVEPTWGAQIPKLVDDGRWFYALVPDRLSSADARWGERLFESRDGRSWRQVLVVADPATGVGLVWQPLGMVLDARNRLHVLGICSPGGVCFPGATPNRGDHLYSLHLVFSSRLPDGSIDFGRPVDVSAADAGGLAVGPAYEGLAVDASRRTIYQAYSTVGYRQAWLHLYDTQTGAASRLLIGTPPPNRAWLYPRPRPAGAGRLVLTFKEYVAGATSPDMNTRLLLWESRDGGRTFPVRRVVAAMPKTDGIHSFIDLCDLTLGPGGQPVVVFFREVASHESVYYREGLDGKPVRVGTYSQHAQVAVAADGTRYVFADEANTFLVSWSADGRVWRHRAVRFPRYWLLGSLNLVNRFSGSAGTGPGGRVFYVGASASSVGSTRYDTLLLLRVEAR